MASAIEQAIGALVAAERARPRLWLYRPGPALRAVWERQANEEADREAWLAGIQKRLGLLTRDNVNELVGTRLTELGRATWPSR